MRGLEARLRANPDDWESWLVYADWLTDQGDLRGTLIGLEHKLATAGLSEEEHRALQAQAKALAEEHQQEWLEGWSVPADAHLQWRHGFIVGVFLSWNEHTLDALEALAT